MPLIELGGVVEPDASPWNFTSGLDLGPAVGIADSPVQQAVLLDVAGQIASYASGTNPWTKTGTGIDLTSIYWTWDQDQVNLAYSDYNITDSLFVLLESEGYAIPHQWTPGAQYDGYQNFHFFSRSDGTGVLIHLVFNENTGTHQILADTFNAGVWHGPIVLADGNGPTYPLLSAAAIRADDSVIVIYSDSNLPANWFSIVLAADDSVASPVTISGHLTSTPGFTLADTGTIMAWPFGLVTDNGEFALALYDGSSWTITAGLDMAYLTDRIAWASVIYDGAGNFVAMYVDVFANIIRAGSVPIANVANPADWTWETFQDLTVAEPLIPTIAPPYNVSGIALSAIAGQVYALIQYTDFTTYVDMAGVPGGAPPPPPSAPHLPLFPGGAGSGGMGGFGSAAGAALAGAPVRFKKCCTSGHQFQNARMLEVVRQQAKNRDAWPYVHEFPPAGSIPVERLASIASPAVNTLTPVLMYLVPSGFRFFLEELLQDFEGAAIAPGDALWTVDRDAQLPNVQGAPVQGFIAVPVPLGSLARGAKWPLPRAYEFAPLTTLRSTVINQHLGVGLPNAFTSGFFGYLLPEVRR